MIALASVAMAACTAIVFAHLKGMPLRNVLGLSCIATLAVSPYNYDYDIPILGVGLAVLAMDLFSRAPVEKLALLGLSWLFCGWHLFSVAMQPQPGVTETLRNQLSLGAFGHAMLFVLVWHILLRSAEDQLIVPRPGGHAINR